MIKQDRVLWVVVGILLISVVTLLVYLQFFQQKQEIIERALLNPECQTAGFPCKVKLKGGGSVQLTISPQPVEVMKPLEVRIKLNQVTAKRVSAQFNGVGMNMGMNRYIFNEESNGTFLATVTLPVCIRNRMEWDAEIHLETKQGIIIAPYKFETIKQ
ncbi:MAG TPA: hypothetical protein ENH92_05510 [Ectothiorhodospiraceae bacterium]|nr:hypothetical protein [Ectothiorhodospiraceae bacterium]